MPNHADSKALEPQISSSLPALTTCGCAATTLFMQNPLAAAAPVSP